MTETMDAADDEVYVRLTGDERRLVVEAVDAHVQLLEWRKVMAGTASARGQAIHDVPKLRRVLAKVSEE